MFKIIKKYFFSKFNNKLSMSKIIGFIVTIK